MNYCLWLETLWYCSNFYNNEFSIFNIGVFLAVIWVFFAGFQLMKENHKIRLNVRINNKILIFLLILPIIFIIISTLLPYIPWKAISLLWYRIFWEILTAIYIIIFWIYLIFWVFLKPINKFNEKSDILNNNFISRIAKNKDIDTIVDEFIYFFDDFIVKYNEFNKLLNKHNHAERFKTKWLNKNELNKLENNYSEQFLLIIENKRFIKQIILKPWILDKIISYYTRKKGNISYHEQNFVWDIILESLNDENSLLVHELWWEIKFNHNKWIILNKIVTNINFLDKINLYSSFYKYYENKDFSERWLKFSSLIIEEFLHEDSLENNYLKPEFLFKIFKKNSRIIFKHFFDFDHLTRHKILPSNFGYDIWEINDKLLNLYKWNFPEIHIEDREYKSYEHHNSNISILDAIAFGLFEYIIYLETFKKEDIRDYTIECSFYQSIHWWEKQIYEEIENRILLLFKNQIKENLNWRWPMVSRVFFENYLWNIIVTDDITKIERDERIMDIFKLYANRLPEIKKWFLYGYNKETIKWKIKKAKIEWDKIIDNLFPKYIEYNNKNNTLNIFPKYWITSYILYLNKIKTWKIVIKKI